MVGLVCLSVITGLVVFGDYVTKHDPDQQGNLLTSRYLSPSTAHLFGTDKFGRDVFSRVLSGGKISLAIAGSVVVLSITIGLLYGAISAYFGGVIDALMMRVLDFLLAIPAVFLIITIVAIFQINHWYLIPILGLTGWMETARVVRAEVLSVKERDFVLSAKALGFSWWRILLRHVIPNCLNPVIIAATFKVGEVILVESALSFLGIGVQPPTASWGSIINDGRHTMLNAWWISTFPGFFIVLTVLSFNLIGDALRDTLNPRT
ncbi:ABC transporter permease [bacterium]|nr:ABC transporter permease [bacterium]